MGLTPLTFTGVSQFSNDFQTILDRAVKIASLPVQQLQNQDLDVLHQKTLLGDLSSSISDLETQLTSLTSTAENHALTASSSDPTVVSVNSSTASIASNYTINSVTSIATTASERSLANYADSASTPVSSTGDLRLTVGANSYDFSVTNNSLVGVRDAINALGAGVTASILTTGSGNYLSISANASGQNAIQLYDDPTGGNTALLTADNPGSNAVFQLNGIPITQSQNLVNTVIPGVTFTLEATSASPVTITLSSDRSQLSSALQSFVNQYNATKAKADAQVGPSAGLLTGSFVVRQLQSILRNIASYRSTTGTVNSLTDLGITFDDQGKATFDSSAITGLSDTQLSDAFKFLGDATQGLGQYASSLQEMTDPINGLIVLEQDGMSRVDKQLQDQIGQLNQRIDVMKKGLSLKLQQADSLLASLESQQNTVSASLQGLNYVLYGAPTNTANTG